MFHHYLTGHGRTEAPDAAGSPADALRATQLWMLNPHRTLPPALRHIAVENPDQPFGTPASGLPSPTTGSRSNKAVLHGLPFRASKHPQQLRPDRLTVLRREQEAAQERGNAPVLARHHAENAVQYRC